jgi:phytoene desaturase
VSGRVIVVGAGLGGLAAACHLVGAGYEVTVLERQDAPGGRAGQWVEQGFRFDTGPSVLTMRDLLARTFAAAGADLEDHLSLVRLDPAYRAVFWDGSEVRVRAERQAMADEVRRVAGPADAAGFERFVDWVTELYHVEFGAFIDADFRTPLDLLAHPGALARLVRAGGFGRLQTRIDRFFDDERLRRLFSFQAMYAGLSPLDALALYAVIAYMDSVEGVWFPDGGMHAVAAGLAAAVTKAGGEVRTGVTVEAIEPARGPAPCRVRTAGGEVLEAEVVVANPDLPIAYETLLDTPPPRRVAKGRYSPSCVVWLLGAPGAVAEGTEHHNIHFAHPWASSFDELLVRGRPMSDPSRFVTVASITDPAAAPAGAHGLYVLEPVPNLGADLDWTIEQDRLTERMLAWAGGAGYLSGDPVVARTITPVDWRAQGMARGTPFSLDHRFSQSGPFRPSLVDRRLPGVVFVGSGTRPGVGVPMVLLSGRLAAARVEAICAR